MELLKSLFENADLPADFQEKTKTLFEAAIAESLKIELATMQESFDSKLELSKAQFVTESIALIDGVVEETVIEWAKENAVALDSELKSQLAESFLSGLKGLFEKADVTLSADNAANAEITSLQEQVATLTKTVEEAKAVQALAEQKLVESQIKDILAKITEGLSETTAFRVTKLCEAFQFKSAEDFEAKALLVLEAVGGVKGTVDVDGTKVPVDGKAAKVTQADDATGEVAPDTVVTKPGSDSAAPFKGTGDDATKTNVKTPMKTEAELIKDRNAALAETYARNKAEYAPHLDADMVSETLKLFK